MKIRIIINHVTGEYEGGDREMTDYEAKLLINSLANGDSSFAMTGRRNNCIEQYYKFSTKVLGDSIISYRIIDK